MTDALRKLIEAVESGRDDSEKWEPALGLHGFGAMMAFHGRLDSAKSLHDSLLPGWTAVVGQNAHHKDWCATVRLVEDGEIVSEVLSGAENPARSWLLAILKAKLAEVSR